MDQKKQAKNEFGDQLLEVFNEEYLSQQPGSPIAKTNYYDKDGNRLYMDCDSEVFPVDELFTWYNIVMLDEEYIDAGDITGKMKVWHAFAIEADYITEETPKEW